MENTTIISKVDGKIRGYRLKSLHTNYIEGYITDFDYREVLWFTINRIRRSLNLPELSEGEFDEAWLYRRMEHETWEIARGAIFSTILGKSICVYDFAGNYRDPGFWADYYVDSKVTVFGGAWGGVPDMPSETIPDDAAVYDWGMKFTPELLNY